MNETVKEMRLCESIVLCMGIPALGVLSVKGRGVSCSHETMAAKSSLSS